MHIRANDGQTIIDKEGDTEKEAQILSERSTAFLSFLFFLYSLQEKHKDYHVQISKSYDHI